MKKLRDGTTLQRHLHRLSCKKRPSSAAEAKPINAQIAELRRTETRGICDKRRSGEKARNA